MKKLLFTLFILAGSTLAYDPRTGITTYDDPNALDTTASNPVPSTATDFSSSPSPSLPASAPYSLGYIPDYNALPEYLRFAGGQSYDPEYGGGTAKVANPYAVLWGQQLEGLDNNYNYAITPEGSVQQLFQASNPTVYGYDPESGMPFTGPNQYKTAQELAEDYGWDYGNAARDDHGYALPGMLGGQDWTPFTNPGIHGNTGLDWLLNDVAPMAFMSAAANFVGGPLASGAMAGGMAADGSGKNPLAGAALGMLTAGASSYLTPYAASFGVPSYVMPALAQAGTGMLQGQSSKDALTNAAVSAGIGAGAQAAAPYVNSAIDSFSPPAIDTVKPEVQYADYAADPAAQIASNSDWWKRNGMLAQAGGLTATDVGPGFFPPAVPEADPTFGGELTETAPGVFERTLADATPTTSTMMAPAVPESDPTFGGTLTQTGTGQYENLGNIDAFGGSLTAPLSPTMEQQKTLSPEEKRAQETAKTLEAFGKYGAALAKMHEGRGTPEDAPSPPEHQEGESDADYQQRYAQTLIQYALPNLDAQALADQGLTPGTPEYYEAVMKQMDDVVAHITDGLNPDDANLAQQLRTKSREELDMLERALYVRGQLGQFMGSGSYTDPFTGNTENVVAPEGKTFNPAKGAYQRGLARSAEEMARMSPQEARRYAGGMLSRSPDLYGAQERADEQAQAEAFASQGVSYDDWKRRRGMLSGR